MRSMIERSAGWRLSFRSASRPSAFASPQGFVDSSPEGAEIRCIGTDCYYPVATTVREGKYIRTAWRFMTCDIDFMLNRLGSCLIVNSVIFIVFALSFFHPHSHRDWRVMGLFSGFVVALFTEMYGFPLTIYVLSGWLGSWFPGLNLTHNGGHLWSDLVGWPWDPHLSPFHVGSYALIGGGFCVIASAWGVLWRAQRERKLATTGAYERIRHPQCAGFLAIMVGFLLQWPTLVTLTMFPVASTGERTSSGSPSRHSSRWCLVRSLAG
jgi:protein-S-isoprenylcysteine O-methyltransferase Ste14